MTFERKQFAALTTWFLVLLILPAVALFSGAGWFLHLHAISSAWRCSCGVVTQYAHPLAGIYGWTLLTLGITWTGVATSMMFWRVWQQHWALVGLQVRVATFIAGGRRMRFTLSDTAQPTAITRGMFRPTIQVSQGIFSQLTPEELAAVFDHEQAHVRRFDPLLSNMVAVARRMYFWLPGMNGATESWVALRELTADESATQQYQQRRGLAGALLKMGDMAIDGIPSFSPNVLRVDRLLQPQARLPMQAWRWRYGLVVMGIVVAAVFGVRVLTTLATSPSSQLVQQCHEITFMCQASPHPESIIHLPSSMSFYVGR